MQFREWCLAVGANVWCVKGSNTSTGELLIVERPVQFRDRVQIVLKANCVGDRRLRFYYSSCFWSLVVSRLRDGWIRGLSLFAADIWRSYLLNSQEPGKWAAMGGSDRDDPHWVRFNTDGGCSFGHSTHERAPPVPESLSLTLDSLATVRIDKQHLSLTT